MIIYLLFNFYYDVSHLSCLKTVSRWPEGDFRGMCWTLFDSVRVAERQFLFCLSRALLTTPLSSKSRRVARCCVIIDAIIVGRCTPSMPLLMAGSCLMSIVHPSPLRCPPGAYVVPECPQAVLESYSLSNLWY